MRRWSTLFALATIFSVTILTTGVLQAQDKAETTSPSKKKKKKEADSSATPAPAATPAPTPAPAAKPTKGSPANSAGVSDADIARAQSGGMVWVNTESGVYHKSGRYFGKTKQGKFMSEADAKKANYREAKEEVGTKKK
jgi:hypothetical protein